MKWSVYNQSLVRRGEILLGFNVIYNWDTELRAMDKIKSEIHFIIMIHFSFFSFCLPMPRYTFILHIDKQTEGIAQGHAKGKVPDILDYSIISRRINRLDIKIENDNSSKEFKDDYIIVAIDSTDIKVTNMACG